MLWIVAQFGEMLKLGFASVPYCTFLREVNYLFKTCLLKYSNPFCVAVIVMSGVEVLFTQFHVYFMRGAIKYDD